MTVEFHTAKRVQVSSDELRALAGAANRILKEAGIRPPRWGFMTWTHRNRLVLPFAISAVWGHTAIPAGQGPWISLRLEVLLWTCQLEYLGWLQ